MSMFKLSPEQTLLRDAANGYTLRKLPTSHMRQVRDRKSPRGYDEAVWAEIAAMGWTGAVIGEDHGGVGFGYLGAGLVLEAMGRTLAPSPFLSTAVIAASALQLGGSAAQQSAYLPKIAAGEIVMALAVDEGRHHDPEKMARGDAFAAGKGLYLLTGRKTFVADGQAADHFIVPAKADDGIRIFLVPAGAPGVTVTALDTIDGRGAADIQFDGVELGDDALLAGDGAALLDRILDVARIGIAAEMLGAATKAFETTVDYLKTRTQFGQLIGSFQSMQHRAAEMFVELELTRSAVMAALSALDTGAASVAEMASLAKARAAETFHLVTNEMVQMHGGIGMTDAADPGLYMKRARVTEALYGSAAYHRDRYATLLGF